MTQYKREVHAFKCLGIMIAAVDPFPVTFYLDIPIRISGFMRTGRRISCVAPVCIRTDTALFLLQFRDSFMRKSSRTREPSPDL